MASAGMVTGMIWVTGNGGLWKRAWRWALTDDGDGHTTGMHGAVDDGYGHEWRSGSAEVFPQEPTQAHGRWLTTADTVQSSPLSLSEYVQFTRPMHSFLYPETRAPTRAHHNYTHPIVHPSSTEEHHNHLDANPDLEPRTTIQQQGIVPRLRVIHYADDTLLLLLRPRLLSLLCVLFYEKQSSSSHPFFMHMCFYSWLWTLKQSWTQR